MKKAKLLLFMLCAFVFAGKAQSPYYNPLVLWGNVSSGTYTNTPNNDNASHITSNQQISGNAHITYLATEEIDLINGFSANPSQEFDARINNVDVADMSKNNHPWNPKKYERFEIGVQVMPNIQGQINAFLNSGNPGTNKLNPYDPEQIKIKAEFEQNSTIYVRYGFYYKEYKQQANYLDWDTLPRSPYTFRVRLAPPATGVWTFTMHLIVNNSDISQFKGSFNVQNGTDNDGFLTIDNNLRRFKFQESGNVFFGIGQNIANADWMTLHNGPAWANGWCGDCVADPYSYNLQRSYIKDLVDKSGNFVRIRMDEWSNPVQSQDVHQFANSDNPNLTLTPFECLNNYDHNQRHMCEMDSTLALCENGGLYIMLNLLNNGYFSIDNVIDPERPMWQNNPYAALLNDTTINGIKSFFTNPSAINYYKKFLFYVQARWGYSPHIALWEHVNETVHLGNDLYETNTQFRADVNSWICNMKSYLETGDNGQNFYPWHPHTTGHPPTLDGQDGPACLNVWSNNNYQYGPNVNYDYRYNDVVSHWNNAKPFIHGEAGCTDAACTYVDKYGDREFHNAIWAGTFSGAITTPMYFWDWNQEGGVDHRQNFVILKGFTDLLDFNQVLFPRKNPSVYDAVYNFQLCNDNPSSSNQISLIYGWAQNASHFWATESNPFYANYNNTCLNISGQTLQCSNVYNYIFTFNNMQSGLYQIVYYNPYNGLQIGSDLGTVFNYNHTLTFLYNFGCVVNADVAYIVQRLGARNSFSETKTQSDTIYANQNPYCMNVKETTDDWQKYDYRWDFGNGNQSKDSVACVNYIPGTYTISLCYLNSKGDTLNCLKQQLVVLDSIHTRLIPNLLPEANVIRVKNQIKIYPNPSQDFVCIVNESGIPIDEYKLFNLVGSEILCKLNSNQNVDLSNLVAGTYLLNLSCGGYKTVFKIVKTD